MIVINIGGILCAQFLFWILIIPFPSYWLLLDLHLFITLLLINHIIITYIVGRTFTTTRAPAVWPGLPMPGRWRAWCKGPGSLSSRSRGPRTRRPPLSRRESGGSGGGEPRHCLPCRHLDLPGGGRHTADPHLRREHFNFSLNGNV